MTTLANQKAILAALSESAPVIIFGSGYGDTIGFDFVEIETTAGRALVQICIPPAWASTELLMAFSDRATASATGRCPRCAATINITVAGASALMHEDNCRAGDAVLIAMYHAEAKHRPTKEPA